ncbi:MAG: cysteine desulfurase [Deltaproteobacteria bacterium]|jgi:cysteine desulfurase|nr:cysteine desulfurase [Deltaproteobacteria bacterium]
MANSNNGETLKAIYVDNAATTAVSENALSAMLPFFRENFGNPSAIHNAGLEAKKALEAARTAVAKAIGAFSSEIYFTCGGTESDNWALRGICASKSKKGRHIISTEIEHKAVLNTLAALQEQDFQVTLLKPDGCGVIAPEALKNAIRPDTILISIMLANNVVGTIQPIERLAEIAKERQIIFHTDAVQAVGHIPIDVRKLSVDLLSLSAHNFHGPKGVGALYSKVPLVPAGYMTGGGQERGHRSGTEHVPGIVGLGAAIKEAAENMPAHTKYLVALRDRLIGEIAKIPQSRLTGHPTDRLPGHASFVFEGIEHSVYLINSLNEKGIYASSGSACSAASTDAPHVLTAMGLDTRLAHNSLRITLSADNTQDEIDRICRQISSIIPELRNRKTRKRTKEIVSSVFDNY